MDDYKFEIGDEFVINHKNIEKLYKGLVKCTEPNKVFSIEKFSKSGISVYYYDNRTNIKCKCQQCDQIKDIFRMGQKSIGISQILLVRTYKQKLREIKLNKILKNN